MKDKLEPKSIHKSKSKPNPSTHSKATTSTPTTYCSTKTKEKIANIAPLKPTTATAVANLHLKLAKASPNKIQEWLLRSKWSIASRLPGDPFIPIRPRQ